MDALSFDVQRCVNWYPMISEVGTSATPSALRGTPGKTQFATPGGGPIRGAIACSNLRAFCVSGNELYELYSDGTSTLRGTLNTATIRVSIAENGYQVMIVDGTYGYIYNMNTEAFTQISDPQFPPAGTVCFLDGYLVVNKVNTDEYYISAIDNGTSWDAADFSRAQSNPDNLEAVFSDNSNLWLMGKRSIEVHQNTGNAAFPFERIPGAVIQVGLAAAATAQRFDNAFAFLGVDDRGRGVVWRTNGYNVQRLSTQAIEARIAEADDFTESYAWVYNEQGHEFYMLQIRGLDTTLVYDAAVGQWHERAWNNGGVYAQDRGSCHMFAFQKNLVGDRESGILYDQDLSYFDDNGVEIIRDRIAPHIIDEKNKEFFNQFELNIQTGIGNADATDPQVMMQYSNDGGRNWSSELWRSAGEVGAFSTRVRWQKLGDARDRVYKVRVSDPVFWQINGAYLNAS